MTTPPWPQGLVWVAFFLPPQAGELRSVIRRRHRDNSALSRAGAPGRQLIPMQGRPPPPGPGRQPLSGGGSRGGGRGGFSQAVGHLHSPLARPETLARIVPGRRRQRRRAHGPGRAGRRGGPGWERAGGPDKGDGARRAGRGRS